MFLQLSHTKLDVYALTKQFVRECYIVANRFPSEERFILGQQIKRAALSVHLNFAEGSSRKSDLERRRFYEIARGSIVEIDAALDIAVELKYLIEESLIDFGVTLLKCFKYISALIKSINI
jgi:four helix bundle protein